MDFIVIDGVEYQIPFGYNLKISYKEMSKSIQTLSGSYVKDNLPFYYTFSLVWHYIDSQRYKKITKIYENANKAEIVAFKCLFDESDYHIKTKAVLCNLKVGDIEVREKTGWIYKNFSFDIL